MPVGKSVWKRSQAEENHSANGLAGGIGRSAPPPDVASVLGQWGETRVVRVIRTVPVVRPPSQNRRGPGTFWERS